MPRADNDVRIIPSVLVRLLDNGSDYSPGDDLSVRGLKQAVGVDLEALLNARREALFELSPDFAALGDSLLTYGLPDFTALNLASQQDRTRVIRALEQAIAMFEPRLDRVRVRLEDEASITGLHFRVEAMLRVDPAPEPVTFDAELQMTTQQYRIRGDD